MEDNKNNKNIVGSLNFSSDRFGMNEKNSKMADNSANSESKNKLQNTVYGMDAKEFERHINVISNRISIVESDKRKRGVIEKYEETERELLGYINNKDNSFTVNQKKIFKIFLRQNLHEKFLSIDTENRKELENKIIDSIYKYIDGLDDRIDLKTIFGNQFSFSNLNVELNDIENLTYLLKAMEISHLSECKSHLCSKFNIDAIPQFMFHAYKKFLKQKVRKIWKINYEIPVNNMKLETKFGYKFLNEKFLDLINERFNLFDARFFVMEERIILLKILFLTNIKYLNSNQLNLQTFFDNYRKYIYLMDIGKHYKEIIIYVTNILDTSKNDQIHLDELNKMYDKLREYLLNNFSILYRDSDNEKILVMIFSFSIMLNNLMTLVNDSVPGCEDRHKAVFSSELKISSRERQFMINLFKSIDNNLINFENDPEKHKFSCLDINFMLENSIFSSLIKSYTQVLFDELNKTKLIFNKSEIFEILESHCESASNSNDLMTLYKNFKELMSEKVIVEKKKKGIKKMSNDLGKKLKFLFSNFKSKMSNELKPINVDVSNKIKIDLSDLKFVPFDPINISTHICISINGHILEGDIEKMWSNFTINEKSVDHYFFRWIENISDNKGFFSDMVSYFKKIQSGISDEEEKENNKRLTFRKNKEISKIYGKILAYILASRSIFRFHSISLIGYSLGCNVIKHCLLEMNKIYDYCFEVNQILQNIVFIAGATKFSNKQNKYKDLFKIIAGRIVNCFSSYDSLLADTYSEDALGLKALPDDESDIYIENYDFSEMKLNHDDYKRELATILNHIKIL